MNVYNDQFLNDWTFPGKDPSYTINLFFRERSFEFLFREAKRQGGIAKQYSI